MTLSSQADLADAPEQPRDGYGPGYIVHSLASDFHALCCLIGKEAARQELAEIVNYEFEGKRNASLS